MKQFFKFLSAFALGVTLLAGCEKEQSSLTIEDIPEKATIVGSYYYDAGVSAKSSSSYVRDIEILANHPVYVQIDNSTLQAGATGVTIFATATNAKGEFEITVPVSLTTSGVSVEVYPEPFVEKYSEVVGLASGKPVVETYDVVYKAARKQFQLKPNDIVCHNALCTKDEPGEVDTYSEIAKFRVILFENRNSVAVNSDATTSLNYTFEQSSNADVYVTIDDFKYGVTAYNGVADFAIPVSEVKTTSAVIEVKPYASTLNYYYFAYSNGNYGEKTMNNITLDGSYRMSYYKTFRNTLVEVYDDEIDVSIPFSDVKGMPVPVMKIAMMFSPFESFSNYDTDYWNGAVEGI